MILKVSNEAAAWYKEEFEIVEGEGIRFFGKVYGPYKGYSFGVEKDIPKEVYFSTSVNGVIFFIDELDGWFFSDKKIIVSYANNQPEFEVIIDE